MAVYESIAEALAATSSGGSGTITGPVTSVDNALVRLDGITGAIIQDSAVILDDLGNLSAIGTLSCSGDITIGSDVVLSRCSNVLGLADGLVMRQSNATNFWKLQYILE